MLLVQTYANLEQQLKTFRQRAAIARGNQGAPEVS